MLMKKFKTTQIKGVSFFWHLVNPNYYVTGVERCPKDWSRIIASIIIQNVMPDEFNIIITIKAKNVHHFNVVICCGRFEKQVI